MASDIFIPFGPGAGGSVPTGVVLPYAGPSNSVPEGWLLCDGTAVSRTAFADLFRLVSTDYGAGDGSTTFNLPDPLGRSIVGAGAGAGLTNRARAAKGGEEAHQLSIAEMPQHSHPYSTNYGSANNDLFDNNDRGLNAKQGTIRSVSSTDPVGGTQVHNNMQPFLALNFIIKT